MSQTIERAAYWVLKDVDRAIRDFCMIENGDRIAVAVSGGKDSLSLMRLLDLRRKWRQERYDLIAVHVPADARGPQTPVHNKLLDWLAANGYEYMVAELDLPASENLPLTCHRCTWNRRKSLFQAAERARCNVVAFGHHADDLAQTTLLNLLYHGKVETMAPRRDYFNGKLRLVRPLCYVPEAAVRRFARACDFPSPPEQCPQSDLSRRNVMKALLRLAQSGGKNVRKNLLQAGLRGSLCRSLMGGDFERE